MPVEGDIEGATEVVVEFAAEPGAAAALVDHAGSVGVGTQRLCL